MNTLVLKKFILAGNKLMFNSVIYCFGLSNGDY